ncbi:helix-turn-helix domain-containing protein [Kribbella sp. NPDC059898]|uniref:helix-turn-helix domain-containing protein n=1 Tax=Kribbella sp. NPDC059898 TaxID=3346995 RepID=UPI00364FE381
MRRCEHCEAALSQHNPGSVCGACAVARRDLPSSTTFKGPADVLVHEDVVAALRDWNWSAALRAISAADGVTQMRMSEATGLTQSTISRLMNGRVPTPTIQTIRSLCDGLGIPRGLAGLAAKAGPARARSKEDATDRRRFLSGVGASAAASVWSAFGERPDRMRSADAERELDTLHSAVPRLQQLSDEYGGTDALCTLAVRLAGRADEVVQSRLASYELTQQAQSLAGQFSMMAGWLHLDGGDQTVARIHWQHALFQAQLANDLETEVFALSSLSNQATFSLSRAPEGLLLAQRATAVASGWASPRLRSLLLIREAAAWAARHEPAQFDRLQRQAANLLPDRPADDDPEWLNFYDRAEYDGLRALSYGLLGDAARSQSLYRDMIDRIPLHLQRNRLLYTTLLARSMVSSGDVVGAAEVLTPHLASVAATGSRRARHHIRAVARAARASRTSRGVRFADQTCQAGLDSETA